MATLGTAGRTLNDGLKPSLYSHGRQRLEGQPEDKGKRLPSWLAAKPGLGHLALLLDPGPLL